MIKYKLNVDLVEKMLRLVDGSDIIKNSYKHLSIYNLICASVDRIKTCAYYINDHMEYPKTEEDFICLFTFIGMLYDCILRLTKEFGVEIKFDNSLFVELYGNQELNILEEDNIKDNHIFEYLRSLIFAHPTDTNRVTFLKRRNEHHVSPWVIVYGNNSFAKDDDKVGIRLYSDKQKEIINLEFNHESIFAFSFFVYSSLDEVINNIEKIINKENELSLTKKIDRGKALKNIFEEAKLILELRCQETYYIDHLINIAKIELSDNKNNEAISIIHRDLLVNIESFINAIDENDNEELDCFIQKFFPDNKNYGYNAGHYHRSKIFEYLSDDSSESNLKFAKDCLETFYNNYAKYYVYIDINKYDFNDIKTLLYVADYIANKDSMHLFAEKI